MKKVIVKSVISRTILKIDREITFTCPRIDLKEIIFVGKYSNQTSQLCLVLLSPVEDYFSITLTEQKADHQK